MLEKYNLKIFQNNVCIQLYKQILIKNSSLVRKFQTLIIYNNTSKDLLMRIAVPKGMKQLQKPSILDDKVKFQRRSSQCINKAPINKSKLRRSNEQIKNQEKQQYPITFIKIHSFKEQKQRYLLDETLDNHSSYSLNLMKMKSSMQFCHENISIKQSRSANVTEILQHSDYQSESKYLFLESKEIQRLNTLLKKKTEECNKIKVKLNETQKKLYEYLVKVDQMNGEIYTLNLKQNILTKEIEKNKKVIQQLGNKNKQLQVNLYDSENNLKLVTIRLSQLEKKLQQPKGNLLEQKLLQKQQLLFEAANEIKSLELQLRCQNFKFDKEKVRIKNQHSARYNLLNTSFKKFKERIVNTPSNQCSVKTVKNDLFSSDTELQISLDEDCEE